MALGACRGARSFTGVEVFWCSKPIRTHALNSAMGAILGLSGVLLKVVWITTVAKKFLGLQPFVASICRLLVRLPVNALP